MLNDRLRVLTHQFLKGCDLLKCSCQYCKSCNSFLWYNRKPEDLVLLAQTLTSENEYRKYLCGGISEHILNPNILEKAKIITRMCVLDNSDRVLSKIIEAISSRDIFPCLLQSNDKDIGYCNASISDLEVLPFIKAIFNNGIGLEPHIGIYSNLVRFFTDKYKKPTFSSIRSLFLLLCFDNFLVRHRISEDLLRIVSYINSLPSTGIQYFSLMFISCPCMIKHTLIILHANMTYLTLHGSVNSSEVSDCVAFIEKIHHVSLKTAISLPIRYFHNDVLSKKIIAFMNIKGLAKDEFFKMVPILTMLDKKKLLDAEFRCSQFNERTILLNLLTNNHVSNHLVVCRNNIIEDTILSLNMLDPIQFKMKLEVTFQGESAFDAGGVSREFFYLLIGKLFSLDYSMFRLVGDNVFWFSDKCFESINQFATVGTIIALAIYNFVVLPIRFPLVMYKILRNHDIDLYDLAEVEPAIYKSLKFLLEMRSNGEDVSTLLLYFTHTRERFDVIEEICLVPNGDTIPVGNDNLDEYISEYTMYLLITSTKEQITYFKKGFEKVLSSEFLNKLLPDELDLIISGEELLIWSPLQANAKYEGYTPESQQVFWFWEVLNNLSTEKKKQFLRFCTGSDRVPIGGLESLNITIQSTSDSEKLPVSHTCFNVLTLPTYQSKSILEKNLLLAIEHSEGFGLL